MSVLDFAIVFVVVFTILFYSLRGLMDPELQNKGVPLPMSIKIFVALVSVVVSVGLLIYVPAIYDVL